jgi:DNA-directed RNA polymerase subunit delta
MSKKRIVKDYENLPEEIVSRVKMEHPQGFANHLVSFTNKEGKKVSALPFETEEIYYLIRMTVKEARQIINEDEDYDDDGNLRDDYSMEEDFDSGDDEDEDDVKGFSDDY